MPFKVGVFDSGVGGITVLTELRRKFRSVNFVYLGDTANVPYGPKSPAQIQKLSANCARTLKKKNVDGVIVACNTASSWALPAIEKVMGSTPVIGVVKPGVEAAVHAWVALQKRDKKRVPILVLATRATVQSHAYGKALQKRLEQQTEVKNASFSVVEQACPLLVPMIEEGWINHPILHQTIQEYVRPHLESNQPPGIALLGCTHYPWIHEAFQRALPGWEVVNSAWAVAQALEQSELLSHGAKTTSSQDGESRVQTGSLLARHEFSELEGGIGEVEWLFTDPEAVPAFARRLMQNDLNEE